MMLTNTTDIKSIPSNVRYGTDNQVLLKIVPDFYERLQKVCEEDPDFAEYLNSRVHSHPGWRPLDYLKGTF